MTPTIIGTLIYLIEKPSDLTFLHAFEIPSIKGTSFRATHFENVSADDNALSGKIKDKINNLKYL